MRLLDSLTADLQTHPEILVDGYDFGLGAYNIFVHTNSPDETFPLVRASLERHRPDLIFTAGYRDFAEDDYVPMWPPTLEMFELR